MTQSAVEMEGRGPKRVSAARQAGRHADQCRFVFPDVITRATVAAALNPVLCARCRYLGSLLARDTGVTAVEKRRRKRRDRMWKVAPPAEPLLR
jgi:hypothetical protein